jgi:hypothetical protein
MNKNNKFLNFSMDKLKEYEKIVVIILFAFALAMGIVSIVLLNLNETTSIQNLLAIGLAAAGLGGLIKSSN